MVLLALVVALVIVDILAHHFGVDSRDGFTVLPRPTLRA